MAFTDGELAAWAETLFRQAEQVFGRAEFEEKCRSALQRLVDDEAIRVDHPVASFLLKHALLVDLHEPANRKGALTVNTDSAVDQVAVSVHGRVVGRPVVAGLRRIPPVPRSVGEVRGHHVVLCASLPVEARRGARVGVLPRPSRMMSRYDVADDPLATVVIRGKLRNHRMKLSAERSQLRGLISLRSGRPYSAERSSARRPPRRTARRSRPDLISGMGTALCHLADRCKVSNVSRGRASWKSFSPL
jgi:hypothetical protein